MISSFANEVTDLLPKTRIHLTPVVIILDLSTKRPFGCFSITRTHAPFH